MKMSVIVRIFDRIVIKNVSKQTCAFYCTSSNTKVAENDGEFRVLNLRASRNQAYTRRRFQKADVLPPRSAEMPVDQDWGSVWPGPRTFHPATVPLPLRQGYVKRGTPPNKFGNAELMKIPNFLHLTPPVIQRQCEALKKFCTPWPKALKTDEDCNKHFPFEVTFSSYCHSSPTIRDPMARIVTVKFKLSDLQLDGHAKDKFLRLVGERYDKETDAVTIVTDRCPTRKQNYDYAMYLITAVYHESWTTEHWEALKSEADMEVYIWENNTSKESIETMFKKSSSEIEYADQYSKAVDALMNEGESEYTVQKYGESTRKLLGLPERKQSS